MTTVFPELLCLLQLCKNRIWCLIKRHGAGNSQRQTLFLKNKDNVKVSHLKLEVVKTLNFKNLTYLKPSRILLLHSHHFPTNKNVSTQGWLYANIINSWFFSFKIWDDSLHAKSVFQVDGKKIDKTVKTMKDKKKLSYCQHHIFPILASTISFVAFPSSMFNCFSEEGSVAYHNKNSDWLRWRMFWAQYPSTVPNKTLKSNCLMISHFVIKNFILSAMKILKELFINKIEVSQYISAKQNSTKKHATTTLQYGQYKTQAHNHTVIKSHAQTAVLSLLALIGIAEGLDKNMPKSLVVCMCILLNFSFVWLYLLYWTPCCVWIRWICTCWSAAAWCWNLELLLLELQHRSLILLWFLSNWHGKGEGKSRIMVNWLQFAILQFRLDFSHSLESKLNGSKQQ